MEVQVKGVIKWAKKLQLERKQRTKKELGQLWTDWLDGYHINGNMYNK